MNEGEAVYWILIAGIAISAWLAVIDELGGDR